MFPLSPEEQEPLASIRARVRERVTPGVAQSLDDAELLASIEDGRQRIEGIDDETLGRWMATYGSETVIDAILAGAERRER